MRILRIILFLLLFWAASEGRPETAGAVASRLTGAELTEENPAAAVPTGKEPAAMERLAQPDSSFAAIRTCDFASGQQQPVRVLTRGTAHPRTPSARPAKSFARPCGGRAAGGWYAPVKCRSTLIRFADPVARTYIRRLRRLLI